MKKEDCGPAVCAICKWCFGIRQSSPDSKQYFDWLCDSPDEPGRVEDYLPTTGVTYVTQPRCHIINEDGNCPYFEKGESVGVIVDKNQTRVPGGVARPPFEGDAINEIPPLGETLRGVWTWCGNMIHRRR